MSIKPTDVVSVTRASDRMLEEFIKLQRDTNMDPRDQVIGTLQALRMFLTYHTSMGNYAHLKLQAIIRELTI